MKRLLYPITSTERQQVRRVYIKHYLNVAKELAIGVLYEAAVLFAGLAIVIQLFKYLNQ
jgi:hypothetical protein